MRTHSPIVISCWALVGAIALVMTGRPSAQEAGATFEGVWKTLEVTVPGPAVQTFRPQATLAMFHGRHYSRIEVHADQPRPLLADPATASADQLRAVWGPFVGEAGTFELSGKDVITMRASVAKNPAAMASGASSVYTYRREGGLLTLTQVRTLNGPAANPIIVKLQRVE